jgi:deoxyadenosine/deoxycytidine kinase
MLPMPIGENRRISLKAALDARCVRVALEGNIGAGKSSVTAELQARGYRVAAEPVAAWTLLPKFYAEPQRYAFALQTQILTSCAALDDGRALITERSAEASLHVFGASLLRQGQITEAQRALLSDLYDALRLTPTELVVNLDTRVDICLARIAQRGRPCEAGITREYLEALRGQYAVYLQECPIRGIQVLNVECEDLPIPTVADMVEEVLAQAMGV